MSELKQCPFCGAKATMMERTICACTYYHVVCNSCSATIGMLVDNEEQAAEIWNRRTED